MFQAIRRFFRWRYLFVAPQKWVVLAQTSYAPEFEGSHTVAVVVPQMVGSSRSIGFSFKRVGGVFDSEEAASAYRLRYLADNGQ